jgi:hypothetical protein
MARMLLYKTMFPYFGDRCISLISDQVKILHERKRECTGTARLVCMRQMSDSESCDGFGTDMRMYLYAYIQV